MACAPVDRLCGLVTFNGAGARTACFAFLWIPASAGMTGLAGVTGFLRNDVCGRGGIAAVGWSKPPLIPPWASRKRFLQSSALANGKRRSTCRAVGKVEFIGCCFVL